MATLRWRRYAGDRIEAAGWRAAVGETRSGEPRYGYTWPVAGGVAAYVEQHRPGHVEDRELGTYATEREARAAVAVDAEARSRCCGAEVSALQGVQRCTECGVRTEYTRWER